MAKLEQTGVDSPVKNYKIFYVKIKNFSNREQKSKKFRCIHF